MTRRSLAQGVAAIALAAAAPALAQTDAPAPEPRPERVAQAETGVAAETGSAREAIDPPITDASDMSAGMEDGVVLTGAFIGRDGEGMGVVSVVETPNGALLTAQIEGLEVGEHRFHIHETGRCDPPNFRSAGGHWAPLQREHGYAARDGAHAGDMPNLFAHGENGMATEHVFLDDVTLVGAGTGMLDDDGAAVIVHEKADTYLSDAKSGDRVACAELKATEG